MPVVIRKISLFCSLRLFSPTSLQRAKNAYFSLIFPGKSAFWNGFKLRRFDVKKDFFFDLFLRFAAESSSDNFRFLLANSVSGGVGDKTRNPPQLRLFRPPVSLCFQGFSRVLKTKYFAVLTRRSNILVFPLFWGSRCSDRVWHTRRGIEVVITGLTRNQFASNRTWVRIPSSPPKKSSKLKA